MAQRFYPAVLERGAGETFAVWFPDFPGVVAGARAQDEAMAKAEKALAEAVQDMADHERGLPQPSALDRIALPKGCDLVAVFMLGVSPPNPSERVNVYLPKSLIERADREAAELGMSRSSYFGLAVSQALSYGVGFFTQAPRAIKVGR